MISRLRSVATAVLVTRVARHNNIQRSIFKAYDIRGVVGENFGEQQAFLIGRAVARSCHDCAVAAVGRDGRLSSTAIATALIHGLNAGGMNTIDVGAVPTPVLYFAAHQYAGGSGLMVTGSHNPAGHNGIKIMLRGHTLAGDDIQALYEICTAQNAPPQAARRATRQTFSVLDAYLDRIAADIRLQRTLKVAVDCGNGIAGPTMLSMLARLGCTTLPLYCQVDGSFPHHHPNPSVPENLHDLSRAVRRNRCDIGIALDGDGDRLGAVDDHGNIIWPDRQMMLFAQAILPNHPGRNVIYDIKSSHHLAAIIRRCGGVPHMCRSGHSFIKAALKDADAVFAGEMSGHLFFNDRWFGFDDGVYSAARLIELLSQQRQTCSSMCHTLPVSATTPEINIHFSEENAQHEFMLRFIKTANFPDADINLMDGLRAEFARGWGLVRASNTTSCLVMRFEADNHTALAQIQALFRDELLKTQPFLSIPFGNTTISS